jgi:hypothetical protein
MKVEYQHCLIREHEWCRRKMTEALRIQTR